MTVWGQIGRAMRTPGGAFRDWALFVVAAAIPALALGFLALRALQNEEAAIRREAQTALEGAAERARRVAETDLERQLDVGKSAKTFGPGVSFIVYEDGELWLDGPPSERPAATTRRSGSTSTECSDLLARRRDANGGERDKLREQILTDCRSAKSTSGRFIWPLVALDVASPDKLAPLSATDVVAWLDELDVPIAERASIEQRATSLGLTLGNDESERDDHLNAAERRALVELALSRPTVQTALSKAQRERSGEVWEVNGISGQFRNYGARTKGVVTSASTLRAWLASTDPAELELNPSEHRLGVNVAPREGSPHATAALSRDLVITAQLANPNLLAERTSRSRRLLGGLAALATLAALAFAAVSFARLRAARRASELRTGFVAAVSHELRTPTTSIRMLSELLATGAVEEDERAEVESTLFAEAQRLSDTIERLLRFGRLAGGKDAATKADVDIGALTNERIDDFERRFPDAKVKRTIASRLACVDATLMGLAIDNLLNNARKYAPDGAPYEVAVAPRADDGRDGITISVRDHGPGIDRRHHKRIFQPFERVDDRLSKAVDGTGLGLSLVDQVARAHGGEASVSSAPGSGATFTIWIPT